MSLSAWATAAEREGPGGGRDGVIALRTIRLIAFSDCARHPRQQARSVPYLCGGVLVCSAPAGGPAGLGFWAASTATPLFRHLLPSVWPHATFRNP